MSADNPTIRITKGTDEVVMVNVFDVLPERQAELVDALSKATLEIFMDMPGFITASLHASVDGKRVVNYAQWASKKLYDEAQQRDDVREHIMKAGSYAQKWDPTYAQVWAIHHGRQSGR
jgi:hypothetical protein